MKERFEGEHGKRLLVDALREQKVVEFDADLAAFMADKGSFVTYKPGDRIVEQGAADNEAYFLLDGKVEIVVNGRTVATRGPTDCIGEMALLSPSARRSATVAVALPTLAFKIDEPTFQTIADRYPKLWRPIARVIAERLREREKFHRPPNPNPVLFLGSSVEGLPIAQAIVSGLKHDKIIPRPWSTPGLFNPGGVSIDVLFKEVDSSDFAAFVFGPDDKITSRDKKYYGPRDNVVFELGLFMGRLDRTRSFIVKEHKTDVKIPTDLLGVTPITYVQKDGQDIETTIMPVCEELRKTIKLLGVR